MKYRIKNDKLREAAITLFGNSVKEFDFGANLTAIEISFAPLHTIDNEPSCIFHPLTNELEIEPIKELAEGWHPYPAEKPEKANEPYLIALKNDDNVDYLDTRWFDGKVFDLWDESIFAWRERPKLWKE